MNQTGTASFPLASYFSVLRDRLWMVILAVVVFSGAAAGIWLSTAQTYKSTAQVAVGDTAATQVLDTRYRSISDRLRDMENEINYARGDEVRRLVFDEFGRVPSVSIKADPDSDALTFEAVSGDPQLSADWANGWAEAFVTAKRADSLRSIESATEQLRERIAELRELRSQVRMPLADLEDQAIAAAPADFPLLQLRIDRLSGELEPELNLIDAEMAVIANSVTNLQVNAEVVAGSSVTSGGLFQRAVPASASERQSLAVLLPLGIAIGLISGCTLALIADSVDTRLVSADEVHDAFDIPVLAVVGKKPSDLSEIDLAMSTLTDRHDGISSAYHQLRAAVLFAMQSQGITSVLVTSAEASEGKSTTALNLAGAVSSAGVKTILLDADYRRPRMHQFLSIPSSPGASQAILENRPLAELGNKIHETDGNLVVFTTGTQPSSPADFVASAQYTDLIRNLRGEADFVIIDGPPLLPVADSASIASSVDGVILVIRSGRSRIPKVKLAIDKVEAGGGTLLGIVITGGARRDGAYSSYYQYTESEARESGIISPLPSNNGDDEASLFVAASPK